MVHVAAGHACSMRVAPPRMSALGWSDVAEKPREAFQGGVPQARASHGRKRNILRRITGPGQGKPPSESPKKGTCRFNLLVELQLQLVEVQAMYYRNGRRPELCIRSRYSGMHGCRLAPSVGHTSCLVVGASCFPVRTAKMMTVATKLPISMHYKATLKMSFCHWFRATAQRCLTFLIMVPDKLHLRLHFFLHFDYSYVESLLEVR
jgi:hypothetical protein